MHQMAIPPMVTAALMSSRWFDRPLRDVRRLISSSVDAAPTSDTR